MIIFGWGKRKIKVLGPVGSKKCENCSNDSVWSLVRASDWFTLFFIPIFPYLIRHHIICSVCGASQRIKKDKLDELKAMSKTNFDREQLTQTHSVNIETKINNNL